MENPKDKTSYWIRVPILTIDLVITGILYLLSVIFLFSNTPTAAELGYNINSSQVAVQQLNIVLLGALMWIIYSFGSGLLITKSLGHFFLGTKLNTKSRLKSAISLLLSPLLLFDKLLSIEVVRDKKESVINKFFKYLASFGSIFAIPGMFGFILLVGFVLFVPTHDLDDNFTLCGERFCLVQANDSCQKNLDLVRSRVVEIVGQNFTGTGFLISDSLVLTNYHVVEHESVVSIIDEEGQVTEAVYYSGNPELDIAILIGQFPKGEHIQFVNPKDFGEGTTDLYAIGYPGSVLREAGTGSVTVTSGIYSSFLDFPNYGFQLVQTDAAINSGNSGGPLVNQCGQVFGMVTLSERYDPYTMDVKEGLNYAISSTTLVPELNRLIK